MTVLTWVAVIRFDAESDFNDDRLMNKIAEAIAELGGENDDEIVGNLLGPAQGSLDDAFDAARGYLQAAPR